MSKIEKLQIKFKLDYEKVIQPFLKQEPKEIIKHSYELAHYYEIADLFDNLGEDNDWFSDTVIDNMIDYQGNVFKKIYQSWLDYSHPEYYNFFMTDDLIIIVSYAFMK